MPVYQNVPCHVPVGSYGTIVQLTFRQDMELAAADRIYS